jgi:hypothetical protein
MAMTIGDGWLAALHPVGPISYRQLGSTEANVPVVPLSFAPWIGPPLGMADDCNKRGGRIIGDASELSCAEVEIVKRLREAGWEAAWVSAFRCGERRWSSYRLAPTALPHWVRDFEARVGLTESGRPDVVAWAEDRVLYVESKGPADALKATQIAWMSIAVSAELTPATVAIVSWSFAST